MDDIMSGGKRVMDKWTKTGCELQHRGDLPWIPAILALTLLVLLVLLVIDRRSSRFFIQTLCLHVAPPYAGATCALLPRSIQHGHGLVTSGAPA